MSYGTFARLARDPSLPFGKRVSNLRSCVQLYRPLGFHATLDFLESRAGHFQRDEGALLRALAEIDASRAAWQRELASYALVRRAAKRAGQRSPRRDERNPHLCDRWHAAPREGALHAVRFAHRRLPGPAAPGLDHLVAVCLAAGGRLDAEGLAALAAYRSALLESRTVALYEDASAWRRADAELAVCHRIALAAELPAPAAPGAG
ncbi:hypothetical protein OG871_29420 [Kitasatospora sp. NBC_00374]|uniref:hypothetical protein n=1 Tax=Kitasatospora sp. NBC_00374 TaxID=2975964 RepID=UPI0030E4E99B